MKGKERFMKKLSSVLVALALLLTLCPTAMASNDFTPAGANWENGIVWNGGTVTLDRDISVGNRIFVNGDTVLDLNGHTITITNPEPILIWENATLTVTGGGEIRRENRDSDSCLFLVSNVSREYPDAVYDENGIMRFEGEIVEVSGVGRLVLEDGTYSNAYGDVVVVLEGAKAEIGTGGGCRLVASGENAACIANRGTIAAVRDTEMLGDRSGIQNLGIIEIVDDCEINTKQKSIENQGEIGVISNTEMASDEAGITNIGTITTIDGCDISTSQIGIRNDGTIASILDTKITAYTAGISNLSTIETIDGCEISTFENNIENYGEIDSITNTQLTSTRTDGGAALNNQGYIGTIGEGVKIDFTFRGIGNDSTHSVIDMISLEYITGGINAISNWGTIGTIAAGEFDGEWHGMENSGTIGAISGGTFKATIGNHFQSTIKEISGGTFSGKQCGLGNSGTVERITGGTFIGRWENMAEDLKAYVWGIDNGGKIGTMSGYTLDGDTGYGIRNKLSGEIDELGQGVLIGELGKVNNAATIYKIFDESILAGNSATGEAGKKPAGTGEKSAPEFTDMANHWAAGDVSALAAEGVINGLPDGTFGPSNDVTRGELAKLVLAVSGREETSGTAAFADTEGTWSMKYVNGLAKVGIIRANDYPEGFQQGKQATRVEVITMLMRSMGFDRPMGEAKLIFTDVEGLTAEQAYYVDCAVRRGIIKGMPDGTLKPDENVSRAEIAAMLRRVEAARPGK